MKLLKTLPILTLPLLVACGSENTEQVGIAQSALTQAVNSVELPSNCFAEVAASDCENSPGPFITLNGALFLGELNVELVFCNNAKCVHEHTEEAVVTLTVLGEGESITIPKQPVLGGVGGNPHILVQLVDANDRPLTEEMYLGRCVQGLDDANLDFGAPGLTDAWLTELSCSNSPGPYINVDGFLVMTGVKARIIFRNNLKGTHETDVVQELTLMADGTTFEFPKQPPLGGVGGNPHIWIRYTDANGNSLAETYLGRCKQLSKELNK